MVDVALIAAAKRSPAYRLIRPRVADPCPSDGWYEGDRAFVVFDLAPRGETAHDKPLWMPQVVFVLGRARGDVLAVRVAEEDVLGHDPSGHSLLDETSAADDGA